jgi:arginine-tRNA-protein transferase
VSLRWNRHVIHGEGDADAMNVEIKRCVVHYMPIKDRPLVLCQDPKERTTNLLTSQKPYIHPKGSDSKTTPLHIDLRWDNARLSSQLQSSNNDQVTLEIASYTKEKFDLYCKYQRDIHNDHDNSTSGFKQFLVESPLVVLVFTIPLLQRCL